MPSAPHSSSDSKPWTFLLQAVANYGQTGALAPSSRHLAALIASEAELDQGNEFLEIGPGTGVFTEELLRRLKPASRLTLIEKSQSFAKILRSKFPQLTILEACATRLDQELLPHGIEKLDSVICGLPWAAMPESVQTALLGQVRKLLVSGGMFTTFAYYGLHRLPAGQRFLAKLRTHFSQVTRTRVEFRNLPPAFVYKARG